MMRIFFDMLFLYSNNLLRIINIDYRPAKYKVCFCKIFF